MVNVFREIFREARIASAACLVALAVAPASAQQAPSKPGDDDPAQAQPEKPVLLQRLKHNNPGLVVDLGVGLWAIPLPMDYDGDGDLDLVVVSPDKPYNGTYFFENPGGDTKLPVFKPAVRIDIGLQNLQVSYVDGQPRVLRTGQEMVDFRKNGVKNRKKLPVTTEDVHKTEGRIRANQWRYVDFDGDGLQDLVIGVGDWTDYGWDDAFNQEGKWTRGPLHGYVYLLRNIGTNEKPKYAAASKVEAGGKPVDVFGMPSPNFADFDGDGDLDLVCGEFLDKLIYFRNTGSRKEPRYAADQPLSHGGKPITMDLQMITPVAIDWDRDGDVDLVVGQEDGRVALVENTGLQDSGTPAFARPVFFKQVADDVKFGALVTPVVVDWDGDGDNDIVLGNTAGYIGFIENQGGSPTKWAEPKFLEADGRVIRILAGENGSIQGPAEAKWGYTTLDVADWDHDGLPDLVVNSIFGQVVWYRNVGTKTAPRLTAAEPVVVEWTGATPKPDWVWWTPKGKELHTQWRTTPVVRDLTGDGLNDLVMLDRDGFLSLFERRRDGGQLKLLPPKHVFHVEPGAPSVFDHNHKPVFTDADNDGTNDLASHDRQGRLLFYRSVPGQKEPVFDKFADRSADSAYADSAAPPTQIRMAGGWAGRSGRRKWTLADWDGDGRLDLLVNSTNITLMRNVVAESGKYVFRDAGLVDGRILAGHDTSPAVGDIDGNGQAELVVGAEDGLLYVMPLPRAAGAALDPHIPPAPGRAPTEPTASPKGFVSW